MYKVWSLLLVATLLVLEPAIAKERRYVIRPWSSKMAISRGPASLRPRKRFRRLRLATLQLAPNHVPVRLCKNGPGE